MQNLQLFIRMYRPHKAREDTILFPAFHSIVSPDEFDALGDAFEDQEESFSVKVDSRKLWKRSAASRKLWTFMSCLSSHPDHKRLSY